MTVTVGPHAQAGLRGRGEPWLSLVAALDASSTEDCVNCGRPLGGLLGTFRWGIQHGVGFCCHCYFPYVYYHYVTLANEEFQLRAFVPAAEIPEEEPVNDSERTSG